MTLLTHVCAPARSRASGYHCLVLHGLGDSMAGWQPAAELLACDELGWIFANAPKPYGPHGGYSWFNLDQDMTPDLTGVATSRAALDALITHLLATLAIPSEKLFLLGFSQGCLMALDVALRGERRFAGIIAISGWVANLDAYPVSFGSAAKQQHILMTHGRHDPLLPMELVREQALRLRDLGITLDWAEYDKDHTLDPEEECADIRAFVRRSMRVTAR